MGKIVNVYCTENTNRENTRNRRLGSSPLPRTISKTPMIAADPTHPQLANNNPTLTVLRRRYSKTQSNTIKLPQSAVTFWGSPPVKRSTENETQMNQNAKPVLAGGRLAFRVIAPWTKVVHRPRPLSAGLEKQ